MNVSNQETADVVTALLKSLGDEHEYVRSYAATAFRSYAVTSLGQLGQATPEVFAALVKALGDKETVCRVILSLLATSDSVTKTSGATLLTMVPIEEPFEENKLHVHIS